MPETLDARGLKCPLPALKTQQRLDRLAAGERLTVLANDPMARIDIPHLCQAEGHTLVGQVEDTATGEWRFEIEKTG